MQVHAQKQSEFSPVIDHVVDRTAHATVGFDLFFIELNVEPREERIHDRFGMLLVKREALFLRHALLFGQGIVLVDVSQRFENMTTLVGELFDELDELAPAMAQAVGQ